MKIYVIPQFISGMMFGIELLEGGVVFDLFILRILILKSGSPYLEEIGIDYDSE